MSRAENENWNYKRITATGQVVKGAGSFGGFIVATGTPTITLYDGTSTSGTLVLNGLVAVAGTFYRLPVSFNTGLYASISGSGDITFFV